MRLPLICLLSILTFFTSISQTRSGFGIHGGVNTTTVFGNSIGLYNDNPANNIEGFQFGMRYNVKMGRIGLCADLNYMTVKFEYPATSIGFNYTQLYPVVIPQGESTFGYISLPVVAKIYLGGFNLQVGAQASSLIGGKVNYNNNSADTFIDQEIFYVTNGSEKIWAFNDTDIAVVIGLGLDTKKGTYFAWRSTISTNPVDNINFYNNIASDLGIEEIYDNGLKSLISSSFSIGWKF